METEANAKRSLETRMRYAFIRTYNPVWTNRRMMPKCEYIESRNGGLYVAESRIGLDVVAQAFRRGRTAEDIFRSFPSIGSLAKVYGVLTFILEHPDEIEAYLREENRFYEEFQASRELPAEMLQPFARSGNEKTPKIA